MIANFILFQLGWFACVLGAANGLPWAGPAFAIPLAAYHLKVSRRPTSTLWLLILVTASGALVDGLLTASGVLNFEDSWLAIGPVPVWMVALWLMFATTLESSLGWLQGRPFLGLILGAIVGPLAYMGGEQLGAITLGPEIYWISLEWGLLLPAGAALARRLTSAQP